MHQFKRIRNGEKVVATFDAIARHEWYKDKQVLHAIYSVRSLDPGQRWIPVSDGMTDSVLLGFSGFRSTQSK